jgi:hypothetical protein
VGQKPLYGHVARASALERQQAHISGFSLLTMEASRGYTVKSNVRAQVSLCIAGNIVIGVLIWLNPPTPYDMAVKCPNFSVTHVKAVQAFGALHIVSRDAKIVRQFPADTCEVTAH